MVLKIIMSPIKEPTPEIIDAIRMFFGAIVIRKPMLNGVVNPNEKRIPAIKLVK
jgi:hypothetical protein